MDPLNELWKIDVGGNWAQELEALSAEVEKSRRGWNNLKKEMVNAGAAFKRPREEMEKLSGAARKSAEETDKVRASAVKIADAAAVQGRAYARLASEANKLNTAREAELIVLRQAQRQKDPLIIQMRAEAAALARVSKALQKQVEDRRFAELAKEAGLKIEEKQAKVFNAEADALERIAAAAKRAAVAKELQARGFDAQGNISSVVEGPSIPDSFNGALTAEGRAKAADAANARLAKLEADNLTKSKLLQNKAYVEGVLRSKELQKQMDELTKSTDATESASNRFLFTFRRLIGVMALFTVARVVTRGFTDMVKGAIRFQAEIESTRVGLSGLIAASAEIRTPTGGRLGIDDQLLLSQQIAIDQMNKLRVDALQTAASYDELARAFQNAVAPGIQSGLTLDQIRKVTVNISQAATGLGLAQDQLAEEIRSLFTGAISARNTRIATALGITPADIARAKQLGTLFEFLDQRFQAISKTGKLLMNTFTGQLSNAADAFKQLLASSSTPLFEQLKGALQDLQKAIFTTTSDAVQLDPRTLAAFKQLFQGLAQGVASVRAAFSKLDLTGVGFALSTLGQSLGLVFGLLANALVLVTNAVNPVLGVFKLILSVVNSLVSGLKELPAPVQLVLSLVGGTYLKVLAFLVVSKKVASVWYGLAPVFNKIRNYMITTVATSAAMPGPLRAINALLTGVVTRMALISKWTLIVLAALVLIDVTMKALGSEKGVFDYISEGIDKITGSVGDAVSGVKGLKEELGGGAASPFGIPVNQFRELKGAFQDLALEMVVGIRKAALELRQVVKTIGLSGAIAQQVSGVLQVQIELESQKAFIDADRQIQALEKRLNNIGGLAAGEKAKAVAIEKKNTEELLVLLERVRNAEKERVAAQKVFGSQNTSGLGILVDVEKDLKALQDLVAEFGNEALVDNPIAARLSGSDQAIERTRKGLNTLVTEFNKLTEARVVAEQIDDLKNEKKRLEALATLKKAQAIVAAGLSDLFASDNLILENGPALAAAKAAADLASNANVLQADAAQKKAAFNQREAKSAIDLLVIQRDINALEDQRVSLLGQIKAISTELDDFNKEERDVLTKSVETLDKQIDRKTTLLEQQKLINAEQLREVANQARLAELRANGTLSQGLQFGLLEFQKNNSSLFDVGSQFATGALNGFAEVGGQAIGSLFDPNSNFELAEAAGQLALRLGTELATAVIKNLLSEVIGALLPGLASSLGFSTAGASLTAAAGELGTVAIAWNSVVLGLFGAADALAAAGAVTGLAGAAARGGRVGTNMPRVRGPMGSFAGAPGFARGGTLGKDHRDTVPAWLRPGEWVIRPEAVALYGDRLFQLLNRRQLNPSVLSGISSAAKTGSFGLVMPRRSGYATGGKVASSAPSGGTQTVVVANYYDEQTMDRSLAAGQQAQLRFARTKRSQYLASLGLTPGG